jgi:hypothetical protein
MLAMDRRNAGAIQSRPCATIRQGVLLFACLPPTSFVCGPAAHTQRGYLESINDRHHRRRR